MATSLSPFRVMPAPLRHSCDFTLAHGRILKMSRVEGRPLSLWKQSWRPKRQRQLASLENRSTRCHLKEVFPPRATIMQRTPLGSWHEKTTRATQLQPTATRTRSLDSIILLILASERRTKMMASPCPIHRQQLRSRYGASWPSGLQKSHGVS